MGHFHPHLAELRKEPARLRRAEGIRHGTLRAVGAMMVEVPRLQISPAFLEKVAVMNLPDFPILIAAQAGQGVGQYPFPIRLPSSRARQDPEQDPEPQQVPAQGESQLRFPIRQAECRYLRLLQKQRPAN